MSYHAQMFFTKALVILILIPLVSLACQPVPPVRYTGKEQVLYEKTKTISIVEYSPADMTVTKNKIEFKEKGNTASLKASYTYDGEFELQDDSIIFNIFLTQTSVRRGNKLSYPVVFEYQINNQSDEPIKIKWDEVSYVDENAVAHGVIKTGDRIIERGKSTKDTVIPPQSKINEIIYPFDSIYYLEGGVSGWRSKPIVEGLESNDRIKIFMPIELKGKTTNYSISFEVQEINN